MSWYLVRLLGASIALIGLVLLDFFPIILPEK